MELKPDQNTNTPLYSTIQTLFLLRSLKKQHQELLLRATTLISIYILAFIVRLFSILRFEPMIHEYDPYFNYRTTLFLTKHGHHDFWNWFDHMTWYPLGRATGATLYPGLMLTAAFLQSVLRFLCFSPHILHVSVLTGPFFASNTAIVTYFFTKEVSTPSAAIVAAIFIAVCPGYTARSVAGSFDNEAVAIFALMLVFYLFLRATKTGSLVWAVAAAIGYLYMVSAWGGYVFVINLLPLYVVVLVVTGRYSVRLYVAYSCMYVVGSVLAMQIRFVGFQHVQTGEHMAAMLVFFLLQVICFLDWAKHKLNDPKAFKSFLNITITCTTTIATFAVAIGISSGYISPWSGRFYALLNPTYAKQNNPIIASVMEHHPTTWSTFMVDLHVLLFLFPAGLYFCFKDLSEGKIFVMLYGVTSFYFAGIMVRLILVAAPALCVIGGIAVSQTLTNLVSLVKMRPGIIVEASEYVGGKSSFKSKAKSQSKRGLVDQPFPFQRRISLALILGALYLLSSYLIHSNWTTSEFYSSPSIILTDTDHNGDQILYDDYREAYFWLRHNTPPDAKVMAWWDYGYQISAMANRTVIVDNNTWNNTHIAMVGKAMSSTEDEAYEIMLSLDVDYVLVVFGGVTGYPSDDIDKFLWMVRIAGGVFHEILEDDYLVDGVNRVDEGAAQKMLNCLMYKLSYYRFGQFHTEYEAPPGYDRARRVEIGNKDVQLNHLEEAFTTSNWIVRIYKVKPPRNRW